MQTRCQVFISSTYTDLIEERQTVVETILSLGQFPMGQEFINASNDTPFNTVCKYIEESDCILLLVGEEYGSIYADEGISYTEAEYNYAISNAKPVFVFAKKISSVREIGELQKFREKLFSQTTVISWNNITDLETKVSNTLGRFFINYQQKNMGESNIYVGNNSSIEINNTGDNDKIDSYKEELKRYLGIYTAKENSDIIGLMINNLGEIKQFYRLTKDQAENAYILAKKSSIAGIGLILIAIILALFFGNNQIAIATTVGGVIVEVLAGTSLFVYQKTLKQLNYYYASLHNNERFLSIINIVGKTNIKDELYQKIVESELDNLKNYEIRNEESK